MGVAYSGGSDPGRPIVDRATCTACGTCVPVCPCGVLSLRERALAIEPDAGLGCLACAQCAMACPTGSLRIEGRAPGAGTLVDLPPREALPTIEQVEALMLSRRSVRRFRPDPVPREVLDRVIAAAATAPMGFPPWEVGVVAFLGRDKVRALASDAVEIYRWIVRLADNPIAPVASWPFLKKVEHQVWFRTLVPLGRTLLSYKDRGRDKALYDAPAALLFHGSAYADGADAQNACMNATLAAEALGLGTTQIGCVPGPLAHRRDLLRKYGVPDGHLPKIMLILGYPAVRYARAVRRPFSSVRYD